MDRADDLAAPARLMNEPQHRQLTPSPFFALEERQGIQMVRLQSNDGRNRLTLECVVALTRAVQELSLKARPFVIAGGEKFFSVGADLNEIAVLTGPGGYEFAKVGQTLMNAIDAFPAPVYAAISGYCMGGGLDLALACHQRIASPDALFGHRGAALGLITGWGGTQRLPRLIGKAKALEVFAAAQKVLANEALSLGLVDAVTDFPEDEACRRAASLPQFSPGS